MDRPSSRSSRRPDNRAAGFLRDSHHEKTLAVAVRTILIQRRCCRRLGHEPPRFFAAFDCSGRQLRRPIFFTLIIDPGLRRCQGRIWSPAIMSENGKILAASIIDSYQSFACYDSYYILLIPSTGTLEDEPPPSSGMAGLHLEGADANTPIMTAWTWLARRGLRIGTVDHGHDRCGRTDRATGTIRRPAHLRHARARTRRRSTTRIGRGGIDRHGPGPQRAGRGIHGRRLRAGHGRARGWSAPPPARGRPMRSPAWPRPGPTRSRSS